MEAKTAKALADGKEESKEQQMQALVRFVNDPVQFKQVISRLSGEHFWALINQQDRHGKTLIAYAICYPDSLREILDLLTDQQFFAAFTAYYERGWRLLIYACREKESLEMIKAKLPANYILQVVQQHDDRGLTALHHALHNIDSLKVLLSIYSSSLEQFNSFDPIVKRGKVYRSWGEVIEYLCSTVHEKSGAFFSIGAHITLVAFSDFVNVLPAELIRGIGNASEAERQVELYSFLINALTGPEFSESGQNTINDTRVRHSAMRN